MQILVINRHTRKVNIWTITTIKIWEVVVSKGHRHFERTVSAKIDINACVAILNFTNWLTIFRNHERWHILILKVWFFATISLNCFGRTCKLAAFAKHGDFPARFNHRPVCFIAVRRNHHTTTTARNLIIGVTKLVHEVFETLNVFWFTRRRNITTI